MAAAFAAVPGSSPHGAAMMSMVDGLRADLDLVTVKTEDLSHIKRIGEARMFRVPVGTAPRREQRAIYARAVGRQIRAEPYQVVHVLDPWAGAAALEPRERGYALTYEICSFPDPDPGEESLWREAHERTLEAADRILVSTVAAARALEGRSLRGRVEVVRPGVDVGAFDWAEVPRFGTPRLLYLGPFSSVRDLPTMLGAIAKVKTLRPVHALIAGERDRQRRGEVRDRVQRAGLADVVEVRGEPNPRSLPGVVAAADVCLAPARDHRVAGFAELPQPLLEYMACYRPVVAAAVPGVQEVIRDEVEGLLHPPGDAGAMADAILQALRDAVLRERITEAGYRRVRSELNSGARRRRIRQVYEGLVPGSQAHDPWSDDFEDVTGLIELSTSAIELLQDDDGGETLAPPPHDGPDTSETESPDPRPGEPTHPRRARLVPPDPPPSPTDTQPGLVVPDTDPGQR